MFVEFLNRYFLLIISMSFVSCASLWTTEPEKKQELEVAGVQHPVGHPGAKATTNDNAPDPSKKMELPAEMPQSGAVATDAVRGANQDDEALKFTRILARLDGMDAELRRQREKLRLLEQGLLTGIAPDDLKQRRSELKPTDDDRSPKKKSIAREDLSRPLNKSGETPLTKPNLDDLTIPDRDSLADSGADSPVMAKIQLAKEHYQAGRFGLAIAELAGVSRDHGDEVQNGAVKFWLGKSYLGLKEYQTARGEFESYLKKWPTGEFVASARLDLAKAFVGLGLRERARNELRRVAKDFEGEESAEMASAELKNIQGSL
jgi:TolA-binding protein